MTLVVAFYLVTQSLLGMGLGALLLRMPRIVPVPRLARFLAGIALAPLASGLWVMACVLLWPGVPRLLLAVGLVIVALLLLVGNGRHTPYRLWRAWRRMAPLPGGSVTLRVLYGVCAVVMTMFAMRLWRNGVQPFSAHDVLNYLSEAKYFLARRSGAGMLGMSDAVDGSVRGSTHGFVYTAMFASALSFVDGEAGYDQDFTARLAAQLTMPALLCALLALTALIKRRGAGALSVLLLIGVPQFEYVSFAASRDAFRIVPLVLLVLLLATLPRQRVRVLTLTVLAGLTTLSFAAHTLNIIVIATGATMWGLLALIERRPWRPLVLTLSALALGVALASGRYVDSYLVSGQLWGELPARYAMAGTVLADAWQHLDRYADSHAMGATQKLRVLFSRDHGLLSVVGLFAAILLAFARRASGLARALRLPAAVSVALVAPVAGLLDVEPYRVSDWFVENLRYVLHSYPFLAVSSVACLVWGCERVAMRSRTAVRWVTATMMLLIFSYAAIAVNTLLHWRGDAAHRSATRSLNRNLELLDKTQALMATDRQLCIDDFGYNYYLQNRALILGSKPSWPVLRAPDKALALARYEALGIGAVVLKKKLIPNWWERLPFYAALQMGDNWRRVGETPTMVAYVRRDALDSSP